MTSPSEVVGTILPAGRLGAMTRLGLLLRDGLPETPMDEPNEKPKPLYQGVVPYPPPQEWQDAIDACRADLRTPDAKRAFDRRDHEERVDIESIEFLLEYRRLITIRLAALAAMHKHGGKWEELRKAIRSQIKVEMRKDPAKFAMPGTSDAAFEDFANADPRYLAAIRVAFREAKEYGELNEELATLEHRIEARNTANIQGIKEMGLQ